MESKTKDLITKEFAKYGIVGIITGVFLYNYHLDKQQERKYTQTVLAEAFSRNASAMENLALTIDMNTRTLDRLETKSRKLELDLATTKYDDFMKDKNNKHL